MPPVRRQHETTSIPELVGLECSAFDIVQNRETGCVGPAYLLLGGRWHRFFLDAGLLFWEEGPCPDPDDDLLENENYFDLGHALGVIGAPVQAIEMHECVFTIGFATGARLVLQSDVDGEAVIKSLTPAVPT